MKREETISKMLGLNQHEAAALLGVSRQLFSLYELGKRDLPSAAAQRLAKLLSQLGKAAKAKPAKMKEDRAAFEAYLKKLLHENEFQQALTEKKIAAAKRKLEKKAAWLSSAVSSPQKIQKIKKQR